MTPVKHRPGRVGRVGRVLFGLAAVAVLAAVFAAYQSPHLAVDLANRVWACF